MYFYYIMSYSNGLLPSTTTSTNKPQRGLPGIGFKLTADGNFDINGKLLTNVAGPANGDDATNKSYVDTENAKQDIAINSKAEKNEVLLLDGSQSMNANLDMNNNIISNLSNGTNDDHAVNLSQLKSSINSQNNYHLKTSFTFYTNFGSMNPLAKYTKIQPFNNHKHFGLFYIEKEGFSSIGNPWAWVSLKMSNTLPTGTYTSVFETFAAINTSDPPDQATSGTFNHINDEVLLSQINGIGGYTIITFDHDWEGSVSKNIVQFTSNGQPGSINFQLRYYGSHANDPNLTFLFYSRVLAGKANNTFDHQLFDANDIQDTNQILYFEDLNMNNNNIKKLAPPKEKNDAANKKYVDAEISKLPHSDTGTLKLDGSRAMIGTLDLGGQRVVNIKGFVEDDSSQAASDAQKYDVVNWGKIHEIRGDLKREINQVASDALNRNNPDPMLDPIDMGNNFITNIKDPQPLNSQYAATVNFVNKTVSDNNSTIVTNYQKYVDDRLKYSVQSADKSNAFQYVMDNPAGQFYDEDDIKGIKKTDKDFHKSNKETYEMQLLLDSRGYYSSRFGVNMYILPNGEYSLVYELYYPNSIDSSTVQISAISAVETVSKVTTNVFNNHTRSITTLPPIV